MFNCPDCGEIEYVSLDGYDFGDRLLEGVMFQVRRVDGKIVVTSVDDWDEDEYLSDLNKEKWMKKAQEYAEEYFDEGGFECPTCGDVLKG